MKMHPKTPHELASQVMDVYSLDATLQDRTAEIPHAGQLADEFNTAKATIGDQLRAGVSDAELQETLNDLGARAERSGLMNPLRGDNAEEVKVRVETNYAWGPEFGFRRIGRAGFLGALRSNRLHKERDFRRPIDTYLETHDVAPEVGQSRVEALRKRTIELSKVTDPEKAKLADDFPGGNFLFHSARSAEIINIFSSGDLLNYKAIASRERAAAEQEGREPQLKPFNSGYEGISWSMNDLDAVPGDRYHVAGFVASPNQVLTEGQQLAVPSRPAPFEMIQISGDIDADKFYSLKVQQEMYTSRNVLGEYNSVQGNMVALRGALRQQQEKGIAPKDQLMGEPMLMEFMNRKTDSEIAELLRGSFRINPDGTIALDESLYQQKNGPDVIPVAAVWFQALIDSGRIKHVPGFEEATSAAEVLRRIDASNVDNFVQQYRMDTEPLENQLHTEVEKIADVSVAVEDMYFVAPRKDLDAWLRVLARSPHMPKGILVYDHKKVRLENFAKPYKGDATALTEELRQGIVPQPDEGYIDWENQILGQEVTPEKRAGSNGQVIAEEYLSARKSIKKLDDRLVIQ